MYDYIIIGAGIVGCFIASRLSHYKLKGLVLEKENDVADEVTMANSGIVHAGYDPEDGTMKEQFNLRGSRMYEQICKELKVSYKRTSAFVVATSKEEIEQLAFIQEKAEKRSISFRYLSGKEAIEKEPALSEKVQAVLEFPTTAVITPWEVAIACMEEAVLNEVKLHLEEPVTNIKKKDEGYQVITTKGSYETSYVINAAGLYADDIYRMLDESGGSKGQIVPVKGEYLVLDRSKSNMVNRVIYPLPSKAGKGVLVVPTIHGNLLLGPNADEVSRKDDVSTSKIGLSYIREALVKTVKQRELTCVIRTFAGIRAKTKENDFIVEESKEFPKFIHIAGIDSPGLSSAPAIAEYVVDELMEFSKTSLWKECYVRRQRSICLNELSKEQRKCVVKDDSRFAHIVCRCEQISEGEILDAIHRPVGAKTIKGVKKRVRPGMGRCQGGFCEPQIVNILARELGCSPLDIVYDRTNSVLIKEELKGGGEQEE